MHLSIHTMEGYFLLCFSSQTNRWMYLELHAKSAAVSAEISAPQGTVCRRLAEKVRDQALRRRDTIVAAAGGAGLGVVLSFAGEACFPSISLPVLSMMLVVPIAVNSDCQCSVLHFVDAISSEDVAHEAMVQLCHSNDFDSL
jgi:hypothetical protein